MTPEEYNNCVELYADGIFRFILKNIKKREEAKDVVQNTFEILWRNREQITMQKSKSYLFTVAHHNMIDMIRKNKRMESREDLSENTGHYFQSNFDVKERLEEAFTTLPPDQKSVVLLRDYEGYSYQQISEITGLSEAQVKVYIHRARVALKNYLISIDKLI